MTALASYPTGWRRDRLDAVGTIVTGSTPPTHDRSYYGHDRMFVSPADLGRSKYVTGTAKNLSMRGFDRSRRIPSGSTLFVCIGSTIGKVGMTIEQVATNQQINAIIPRDKVDSEYLYYAATTLSSIVREQAGEQAVPLVNKSDFSAFEILLPPLEEQRAIASALADADQLVVSLELLMAKKQAIKLGVMQRLLTGKTRLPGFTEKWKPLRLEAIGCCVRGVSYDPHLDLFSGERPYTVRLLRSNNVQDGSLLLSDELQFVHERRVSAQQRIRRGDIVICMANGSRSLVGKSAYFDEGEGGTGYTFGAFMGVFRTNPSKADPRFVMQLLKGKAFRNWLDVILAGSSINNLRPSDIEAFEVEGPDMPEQSAIAATLREIDWEIQLLRQRLDKARTLRLGMMQELLSGRTRLPIQGNGASYGSRQGDGVNRALAGAGS